MERGEGDERGGRGGERGEKGRGERRGRERGGVERWEGGEVPMGLEPAQTGTLPTQLAQGKLKRTESTYCVKHVYTCTSTFICRFNSSSREHSLFG